jgi:UDPglucose 6-dehydrogenase
VAFKANTDDVREASAIAMARALVKDGATVHFYDPVATENFIQIMKDYPECEGKIKAFSNKYDCLNGCDGLVTMTEWREFRAPDFNEVKSRLKTKVIFDGRNLYETHKILSEGFDYLAVGKFIK